MIQKKNLEFYQENLNKIIYYKINDMPNSFLDFYEWLNLGNLKS
ncbi:hypothetical protein CHRY9390_01059 [Chryseobacterium aquaeductus]|uniref:Uncharacterized protein n=1 Tax=Chryseobacterium aquaeductus TaxID=2675056 RepID=A0A9N8MEM1_9FLAO|nr:hypothetical protein CHRY9390_01059 [Chryseobacterium potabilaquae]CAD7803308.1 hypothetical protein CHRY9390_01059 [Chryseobacterium aquaeductus]